MGAPPLLLQINLISSRSGSDVMGSMRIPDGKALAGAFVLGHSSVRLLMSSCRCSQGGVKVPTGGKGEAAQARERLVLLESRGKKGQQIRCDSEADG